MHPTLSFRRASHTRPDEDQHKQPQHNGDEGERKVQACGGIAGLGLGASGLRCGDALNDRHVTFHLSF
jgi:hypothetical protein